MTDHTSDHTATGSAHLRVGPGVQVSWGARTDPGLCRSRNEDAFLAEAPLFLVADGMGGHTGGDIASGAALSAFAEIAGRAQVAAADLRCAVAEAVIRVDRLSGAAGAPGTTLSGVGLTDQGGTPCWLVINVGDSRTYRLVDGRLEQVSVDHSEVQEQVDAGRLSAEQARTSSRRNVITRAIGAGLHVDADLFLLAVMDGDRLLICSDGLTGELDDPAITAILTGEPEPAQAADLLVEAALSSGGRDNVTVLVVDARLVAGPSGQPADDLAAGGPLDDITVPNLTRLASVAILEEPR